MVESQRTARTARIKSRRRSPIRNVVMMRYPKVNDLVIINIKPYNNNFYKGIVAKILTKKKVHTRGHKVRLRDGVVGRIYEYLQ